MADTRSHNATAEAPVPSIPVEGDGINYRGLLWFGVILTATTLFCMALVAGLFWLWEYREAGREPVRAPLAAPASQPKITDGRLDAGTGAPQPALLVTEPAVLQKFRAHEDDVLTKYDWVDKNAGTIRIPIDRAKELLLERNLLPVRGATAPATAPATAQKPGGKGK
jgi:hypothetical protein